MGCGRFDVECKATEAVGSAMGSAIDKLYAAIADGVQTGLEYVATFWMKVPSPEVATGSGQSWRGSAAILEMQSWLMPVTAFVAVVSFSVALLQIALSPEQAGKGVLNVLRQLGAVLLGGLPALAITALLIQAGDEFSPWLLDRASGAGAGQGFQDILVNGMVPTQPGSSLGFLLIVFIVALLGSIMQCMFMLLRSAAIIVLLVMLPVTSAGATTDEGWMRLKRIYALLLGFVLYKPVAAIIYATGLRLMSESQGDDVQNALYGLTVIVMGAIALPAFIKFVMPAAAMGSSSAFSGGAALGAMAAGAAVVGLGGGAAMAGARGGGAAARSGGQAAAPQPSGAGGGAVAGGAGPSAGPGPFGPGSPSPSGSPSGGGASSGGSGGGSSPRPSGGSGAPSSPGGGGQAPADGGGSAAAPSPSSPGTPSGAIPAGATPRSSGDPSGGAAGGADQSAAPGGGPGAAAPSGAAAGAAAPSAPGANATGGGQPTPRASQGQPPAGSGATAPAGVGQGGGGGGPAGAASVPPQQGRGGHAATEVARAAARQVGQAGDDAAAEGAQP